MSAIPLNTSFSPTNVLTNVLIFSVQHQRVSQIHQIRTLTLLLDIAYRYIDDWNRHGGVQEEVSSQGRVSREQYVTVSSESEKRVVGALNSILSKFG